MKYIGTEGHGYLQVTKKQVEKAMELGFAPSNYSFYNTKVALLEEDMDMGNYLKVVYPDGVYKLNKKKKKDINRNCYERFEENNGVNYA